MTKDGQTSPTASERIDEKISTLGDWRGETLKTVRRLIKEAEPDVKEEWKWRGTPVWSRAGIICTGETYKNKGKLTQGSVSGGPFGSVQRRTETSDAPSTSTNPTNSTRRRCRT